MIHLLIVDDERPIADWLFELFSNLETKGEGIPEFECYKAYDAYDALEIFYKFKVDILLSDIYMPGMSGLEMMEGIHKTNPFCHAVFLTGYSDFDDIYRATRSKYTRYLSKTEEDAKIIEMVLAAAVEILEEREHVDAAALKETMLELMLQQDFMIHLARGELDSFPLTADILQENKIPLCAEKTVSLLAGKSVVGCEQLRHAARIEKLNHMRLLFRTQFAASLEMVQLDYRPTLIFWVLQRKADAEGMTIPKQRSMLEDFSLTCKEVLGIGLNFMIFRKEFRLEALGEQIFAAEAEIGCLPSTEDGVVLLADEGGMQRMSADHKSKRLEEAKRELFVLRTGMEQGNPDAVREALDVILPALSSVESRYDLRASELYFGIAAVITGCINRFKLMEDVAFYISLGRLSVWYDFAAWTEAADYLRDLCGSILTVLAARRRSGSDIVKKVRQFIECHISEDLSLTRISEAVNYNPTYLSRLFKQHTGENMSALVLESRMEHAVELLETTNDTVVHIAKSCGMENAQYFITVFRKRFGVPPQEYRINSHGALHNPNEKAMPIG